MLWAGWSVLIALVFVLQYWSMGTAHLDPGYLDHCYWSMLHYSVVTFTTLGFGDIVSKTEAAAMWVMLEVAIGYVMFDVGRAHLHLLQQTGQKESRASYGAMGQAWIIESLECLK